MKNVKAQAKAVKVRKNNRKIPKENVSEEGSLRIDELSLTKLLRFQAEERASAVTIQNMQVAQAKLLSQIDPQGLLTRMRNEIQAQEQQRKEFAEQYEALKKSIQERLKIDFEKVSYDDVTGVIYEDPNPIEDAKALKA